MSDAKRLQSLLDSGSLMHPIGETPSIVDCANALHSLMNIPDTPLNDRALHIKRLIGEPDHLVLVLADGFGMNFVEGLDEGAFIRNHLATEMRTVFPSTTPIVLTSLATGEWPAAHSVIGWFVRLRQIDAVSTIISYIRSEGKKVVVQAGPECRRRLPRPVAHRQGAARCPAPHAQGDSRQRIFQLLVRRRAAGRLRCPIATSRRSDGNQAHCDRQRTHLRISVFAPC